MRTLVRFLTGTIAHNWTAVRFSRMVVMNAAIELPLIEPAAHGVYRLHVTLLLREAEPRCDAELLAEMMLGALAVELFLHLHRARAMPLERLKAGWRELVARALRDQAAGAPCGEVAAAAG